MNKLGYIILKVLIFFSLFVYFFPFQFLFMPLPNARIIQAFGILLLLLIIVKTYKINKNIVNFTIIGVFIFFIGLISTVVVNTAYQYQFALVKGLYIIPYLCSSLWVIFLMRKVYQPLRYEKVFEWIVGVTVVNAILSLVLFCVPDIMELYSQLIVKEDDAFEKLEELNRFRLIGIGSLQFANAATHYGITLWIIIYLYTNGQSLLYKNKWVFPVLVPLVCICGILSARTFFLFIPLTLLYIIRLYGFNHLHKGLVVIFKMICPLLIVGTVVVLYLIANDLDMIIDWAFELFINMFEDSSLKTDSTDRLKEMYISPTSIKTWIIGDGMSEDLAGRFYMHSDVGYVRSLYYWGLVGSIIYYCAQFIYYRIVRKSYKLSNARFLIDMLFVWFWIYNFKEFWAIEPYWSLLLITAIYSCNSSYNLYSNGNNRFLLTAIPPDRAQ